MKVTLFIIGLSIAGIAFIVELQDDVKPLGLGFFILAGTMLIAAALWKTDMITNGYFKSVQRVYNALAQGPMEMDDLMQKLAGHGNDPAAYQNYQEVIGRMLSKRQIVIKDTLVTIGEGVDAAV